MKNLSFFWKIFGGVFLIVLVTGVAVDLAVVRQVESRLVAEIEKALRSQTGLFAGLVEAAIDPDEGSLDPLLLERTAAGLGGGRLSVIGPDGAVWFDSHEDSRVMENHGSRPEVLAPGTVDTRISRSLGRPMRYCSLPVGRGGRLLAHARVAIFQDDVDASVDDTQRRMRSAMIAAAALAVLLTYLLSRHLTRPLSQMAVAIKAIGQGDERTRIPVRSHDEVGALTAAVNRMADELEARLERMTREQIEKDAILAGMTEGVVAVDQDQRVVLINAAALEMLEATAEDPRGRPLREITPVPEVTRTVATCIEEGRHVQARAQLHVDDGAPAVLELAASPLVMLHGASRGCVLVLHDVSELRRLEAIRRDFVANVSHELKTPLTAMRGYLETVLDDPEMPETVRDDFLRKADKNTERLSAIVSDLLTLARVESAEGAPERRPLDLRTVAAECAAEVRASAERRLIRLEVEPGEDGLTISADPQMIGTAVRNLLENAIKYSPEGSVVHVRLGHDGAWAWLDVEDQGPGIPAAEQERIFERFYRIDRDRSRALGGTGLGLSIVRNVMIAHEGDVSVESRLGEGSRFRIRLPLCDPAA